MLCSDIHCVCGAVIRHLPGLWCCAQTFAWVVVLCSDIHGGCGAVFKHSLWLWWCVHVKSWCTGNKLLLLLHTKQKIQSSRGNTRLKIAAKSTTVAEQQSSSSGQPVDGGEVRAGPMFCQLQLICVFLSESSGSACSYLRVIYWYFALKKWYNIHLKYIAGCFAKHVSLYRTDTQDIWKTTKSMQSFWADIASSVLHVVKCVVVRKGCRSITFMPDNSFQVCILHEYTWVCISSCTYVYEYVKIY